MEGKKNKRIAVLLAAAAVLLAVLTGAGIFAADRYADKHSVAVLYIAGERHSDTDEAFESQVQCRRGEHFTAGDVILSVTKIDWKGKVFFEPVQGSLMDSSGKVLEGDSLDKGERKNYRSEQSSFSVGVRRIEKE